MKKLMLVLAAIAMMFTAVNAEEAKTAEPQKVKLKIKAKIKGDVVKAKVGFNHEMLTYDQAKRKGKEVNFITHITGTVNDKVVYDASTSQFLSKNPLIKFDFKSTAAKKGDILRITYTDLKGTYYDEKKIK